MHVDSTQTVSRRRDARGDSLRNATLVAGVSLDRLLRAGSLRCMPRPMLVGIGLIAAATAYALIHVGVDVRAGFAGGGQSGLLPSLLQTASAEEAQLAILRSEPDGAA